MDFEREMGGGLTQEDCAFLAALSDVNKEIQGSKSPRSPAAFQKRQNAHLLDEALTGF